MTRTGLATLLLFVVLAGHAAAKPPGPPPKVSGAPAAPPPAWIEAGAVEKWLAYSSYCWRTACVDFIPPPMRKDIPVLTVRRGQRVKVHLRFVPSELRVTQGARTTRLPAAAVAGWLPRSGLATVFARPKAGGDVSYLVRIRLR